MIPIIAIVGRPNVGKSTLFNRLSRSRNALVDDKPGITRDRLYASIEWGDRPLTIIDTGGFDRAGNEPFLSRIREQVIQAIQEADLIIFMVDGRQGIVPGDQEMATQLRRSRKNVYLAVNKVDGPEHDTLILDFYALGWENVYPLSAAHGYGLRTFMDDLVKTLPGVESEEEVTPQIRVAVLGRPNVGKSSLINRILGFDRLLVSDLPGTTRDSVDTPFKWKDKEFLLIDTAGIRRKARVKEKIEKFSMIKAIRSLDRCHIAVILLDASTGIVEQDARICGYAFEQGRGMIIAVNKWDLIKNDLSKKKFLENDLERHLKFASFVPRINVSALSGEGVTKLFGKVERLYEQFCTRIGTGELNRALENMTQRHPPPQPGKGRLKFFYATQTYTKPPTVVIFVNRPEAVHFSYKRFIVNQLRETFGLNQTPIRLLFRKK